MIKLTDFVVNLLSTMGIQHIFVVQGGAVAHLIDSVERNQNVFYATCQHEQACAMAADAYSRVGKTIGAAFATSGPGATNLITGIANAYYDSIPVFFITGNVTTFRQSSGMGVRQYGFQETAIVDIVKPITKYCTQLRDPRDIKYEIQKALHMALDQRKGPVLIDIPDDIQRSIVDENHLRAFHPLENETQESNFEIDAIEPLLKKAKRPVIVYGNGVLSSGAVDLARQVSEQLNLPTLFSWPLKGIFDYNAPLNFGSFGTNSSRSGNFIIQNADLILTVGHRLDTHATGLLEHFGREAKIIMVEIDVNELNKFSILGKQIDIKLCMDAGRFLSSLSRTVKYRCSRENWMNYCRRMKAGYYSDNITKTELISPGIFFEKLSDITCRDTVFIGDTGANLVYLFNGLKEKQGQSFISAFNNTPMGFALPASVGAALADKDRKIICCIGDGGMQMNVQELATIRYYNLPITIVVLNNTGYTMIKQTQDDWFNSQYSASSNPKGIPKLDFSRIASAYGIDAVRIANHDQLDQLFLDLPTGKPFLIELVIDEDMRINPMLKYGRPLEDMNPLLTREEFLDNMIIPPLPISMRAL